MKLFGPVFKTNIRIPEYLLGSQKIQIPNKNTTSWSKYLNSIQIPNYVSHPAPKTTNKNQTYPEYGIFIQPA